MINKETYKRLTANGEKINIHANLQLAQIYNRLVELEDKIENGLLIPRHSISQDLQYGWWCVYGADEQGIIIAQCKTEEEAKRKLEELEK